jgi:hypothetical protein
MEVLSEFDHKVEAHGDTFNFTLKGATSTLTWDKTAGAMNLEIGSNKMSVHSLKQLHDQLVVSQKSPGMHAPADLQACTSAVLRQQARSGLGLRRGPT